MQSLREQLEDKNKIIVLPGVFDALSARIAEQVGFEAMFQTGYGSAAALLGMPDFGFLNAGETVDNARRIIRAVDVPVLVDADTGYGNPLNVWRLCYAQLSQREGGAPTWLHRLCAATQTVAPVSHRSGHSRGD